ncbi:TonB-dependent receptor [Tenacibaculum sp. 190524A05c]|uniref:TonB-dependent receptor n=1 Tax=Tenacibaculum platacis TaxID=3137852 RepID=UPI0032B15669
MKQFTLSVLFSLMISFGLSAQNIVKGVVKDSSSEGLLQGVSISVEGKNISTTTDVIGAFTLENLPDGRHIIVIKKDGYETQNYPVSLSGSMVDLGIIYMYEDEFAEDQDLSTIVITDDELNDDTTAADNISGLLQASRDVYLRTAAFEFSSSFFRIRGLDSDNAKLLINGIEMNKLSTGRPEWANWGGLNDVLRNQEFTNGLAPSNFTFGGVLGSNNISTRASEYRKGGRVSYASSNRSYVHRVMGTYATGLMDDGWAFAFSGSRRIADEGFADGSSYNAYSTFASIEKVFSDKHSLNFTSVFASNRRGKAAPNTQEVIDIKGIQYNPYWGYQNGKIRNSRIKDVEEPFIMLNHYWNINEKTTLNTNVSYQFGGIGNSRIDFNGARVENGVLDGDGNPFITNLATANPDPTYYQKLPSYGVREGLPDVFGMYQDFARNGQLDWSQLYAANAASVTGGNSAYVLYEDRNEDDRFTINTIFNTELTDNISLNASVNYTSQKSENFAEIIDLLGGSGYLDVDTFAQADQDDINNGITSFDLKQNNLLNPLFLAQEGDRFKYDFDLLSQVINGFVQTQFKFNKVDFFLAGSLSRTSHQRDGNFQNGGFIDTSFGKSEKQEFTNWGAKGGLTYKITGRHILDFNAGYLTKAPTLRNTFANSRENNAIVEGITSEKVLSLDASYIVRTPILQARATAYYTGIKDATETSFFFADGIGGDNTAFVQETLQGIEKRHIGAEFGIDLKLTQTLKLKGAANIGQYTYNNNPNLFIASEDFVGDSDADEFGVKDFGQSNLKNYRLASGPQKAYSFGFEYRDPDYWWFGATANVFNDTYIDIAPLTRSSNFADDGGVPFTDYDESIARELLRQERFNDYMVVNAVGGKSWKVGNRQYIGLFASIGNIFNREYRTGGFEQGRNANYRQLRDDKALDTPVFGNKYWYGRGTTYFVNLNYRF